MNVKATGFLTCFKCKGERTYPNGGVPALRKLEVRRVNPNQKNKKKKGKVIAEATVCELCFIDGHKSVPFGSFNGYVKYVDRPQLPEGVMKMLREQKKEADIKIQKAKEAGIA